MRKTIALISISTIIFIAIDLLWLGIIVKDFYQQALGHLLLPSFRLIPAMLFYIIFNTALVVFVIQPGLNERTFKKTLMLAILFGLVTYTTYDLTNYATMDGFPLLIVVIDILWGILLTVMTATLTFFIYRRLTHVDRA